MRDQIVEKQFSEKLTKFYIILGLIMVLLYSTGLLGFVPNSMLIEFAFVIIFIKKYYEMLKGCKGQIKSILLYTLGGFVIFFAASVVCSNILEPVLYSIFGNKPPQNSNNDYLKSMITAYPIIFPILCCVFGPLIEETMYRLVLFRTLYQKNHFLAHFLTALLFGMQHIFQAVFIHGQYIELINIFSYMLAGFILTKIYSKTKNILPCILIHIFSNSLGILFMIL